MQRTEFQIKPSFSYNLLLGSMILTSLLALLALPLYLMIFALIGVLIYGYYLIMRFGLLKTKQSIVSLKQQNGRWYIQTPDETYITSLCNDSVVTPLISVLRFKQDNKKFPHVCVIFRDSLAKGDYCRLCVLCRMGQ